MPESPRGSRRNFLSGQAAIDEIRAAAEALANAPGLPLPAGMQGSPAAPAPAPEKTAQDSAGESESSRDDPESSSAKEAPTVPPPPPDYTPLVEAERQAMACRFSVRLNAGWPLHGPAAAVEALDVVDEVEAQLTVYREASEVIHLNRLAHLRAVEVEEGLFGLISRMLEVHRETAGAFDPTSGPLSRVWGFFERQGAVPADEALAAARELVGADGVVLDPERRTVRFTRSGLELNFNASGKGYALDRAAEKLQAAGVADFLLQGGASSIVARGRRFAGAASTDSAPEEPSGWKVGIVHPLLRNQVLAEVTLRDEAMGTSGCGVQFFRHEGKRLGHILDPRSGQPAEGLLSVSVFAPTAEAADALSTAFFVGGAATARDYCGRKPEVRALLVARRGRDAGLDCELVGLTENEVRFETPVRLGPLD